MGLRGGRNLHRKLIGFNGVYRQLYIFLTFFLFFSSPVFLFLRILWGEGCPMRNLEADTSVSVIIKISLVGHSRREEQRGHSDEEGEECYGLCSFPIVKLTKNKKTKQNKTTTTNNNNTDNSWQLNLIPSCCRQITHCYVFRIPKIHVDLLRVVTDREIIERKDTWDKLYSDDNQKEKQRHPE